MLIWFRNKLLFSCNVEGFVHLFLFEEVKWVWGKFLLFLKTNFSFGKTIHAHEEVDKDWDVKKEKDHLPTHFIIDISLYFPIWMSFLFYPDYKVMHEFFKGNNGEM